MLIFGLATIALAVLAVVGGMVLRRKLGKILAAPLRKTGEAVRATGPTCVEGNVLAQQPLVAPCSGKPCVYYELKLEHKIKEKTGSTTSTTWKTVAQPHVGSMFWLDDGSGPIAVQAQDKVDAQLTRSYAGVPPGGPGFGALAGFLAAPPLIGRHAEVVEHRVTETMIGLDGKLFAVGMVQSGQLCKPVSGKLVVSTRGRDALVGSTRRAATALLALGVVGALGGGALAIVRPGEAKPCGAFSDAQHECVVATPDVVDNIDAAGKPYKAHKRVVEWTVTEDGKFEIALEPVKKDKEKHRMNVEAQVEDKYGLPMNVGINWGISQASVNHFKTKTKTLHPGTYKISLWSAVDGPAEMLIAIAPVAATATTADN